VVVEVVKPPQVQPHTLVEAVAVEVKFFMQNPFIFHQGLKP
jgi:hypothetical protein